MTIGAKEVVAIQKGAEFWRDRVEAYGGVLWREETRGGGQHRLVHQIIELRHQTDAARTVEIWESQRNNCVRGLWEDAARTLNLLALSETAGGIERQAAHEVDQSPRDRVRSGTIATSLEAQAPRRITWSGGRNGIDVKISPSPRFLLMPMAFAAFFFGIFTFNLGGIIFGISPGALAVVALSVVAMVEILIFGLHSQMAVTRDTLTYTVRLTGDIRILRRITRWKKSNSLSW